MGTKQGIRNEVPKIGLGFKFNFIPSYIFPFLVLVIPLCSVAAKKYFMQYSARIELLLFA